MTVAEPGVRDSEEYSPDPNNELNGYEKLLGSAALLILAIFVIGLIALVVVAFGGNPFIP